MKMKFVSISEEAHQLQATSSTVFSCCSCCCTVSNQLVVIGKAKQPFLDWSLRAANDGRQAELGWKPA